MTDPVSDNPFLRRFSQLVVRMDLNSDGDGDVLIFNSGEHVVIGGSAEATT